MFAEIYDFAIPLIVLLWAGLAGLACVLFYALTSAGREDYRSANRWRDRNRALSEIHERTTEPAGTDSVVDERTRLSVRSTSRSDG